jgi:hypothetical protein
MAPFFTGQDANDEKAEPLAAVLLELQTPAAIADDVLLTMQGVTPSPDKSNYPRIFGR